MNSWTYRVTQDNEGKIHVARRNRGFSIFELIGFSEMLKNELNIIFKSMCDDKMIVVKRDSQKKDGTKEEIFLAK